MKKIKFIVDVLLLLMFISILISCSKPITIEIDNKQVVVEPYGWINEDAVKNDSVVYVPNAGDIVWSIVGIETIVIPIILTGYDMYEPVRKK